MRYGRQYFRPISGDGIHFGVSTFPEGVLAFSRILNDQEVVIVANTNTGAPWTGEVIVDFSLNPVGATYRAVFSNKRPGDAAASSGPIVHKSAGAVEIHEVGGGVTRGPARSLPVTLEEMENKILVSAASS